MQHNPRVAFNVKLLDGSAISACFVAHCVDEPASVGATIRASYSLLQSWQRSLIHCTNFELFTLLEVLTFKGASNNVYLIFKLSNTKVYAVVHHLTKSPEVFAWNVKQ
jgi:hypothetical protein